MARNVLVALAIGLVSLGILLTACSKTQPEALPSSDPRQPTPPVEVDDPRDTAVTRYAEISPQRSPGTTTVGS